MSVDVNLYCIILFTNNNSKITEQEYLVENAHPLTSNNFKMAKNINHKILFFYFDIIKSENR